ncbi:MFS transporter [Streptomyces sp. AV19]|uniref:MFS transporter n=1 Tax=Streptomyces sp. AV19 TaxID=2793068 RepID=UPI0024137F26|nr:MFS transporter [Streptomyces sp. AV19]MDG4533844.1 MFS transporter [Streptomyces sp. AV19]
MTSSTSVPPPSRPRAAVARRAAATVVLTGLFLLSMDATVLNVAVPDLQRDLRPTMAQVQWIIDGFPLVLASAVLSCGAAADRFGRRRSFVAGILLCGAASALGASASSPGVVVAARCLMGAGAAVVMPSTLSVLTALFPEPEPRRRAFMAWTMVLGAGGLAGPVAGGALVEGFSWRAGFWVNLPVAAVTAVAALLLVPESRAANAPRVDVAGCLLSAGGLLALVWAVIESPVHGWSSPASLGAYAVAAAALGAFAVQQRRSPRPLLDARVRGDVRVRCALAAGLVMCLAVFGMLFLISLHLQGLLGCSPWEAGLRTLPMTVGMLPGAAAALRLLSRGRARAALCAGLLVVAAGLAVLTTVGPESGYGPIAVVQLLCGAGAGLLATVVNEMVMGAFGENRAGVGSALHDASREVGSALGIAALGSLLMTAFDHRLGSTSGPVPGPDGGDPAAALDALTRVSELPGPARALVRDAFTHALAVTAAVTAGAVLLTAAVTWWALRRAEAPLPRPAADAGEDALPLAGERS